MISADIERFARCRILVIGDVMLDHFIWGGVRRISPEAPVPVVEVSKETWYPGGAANVARNVAPFGAAASIMGRVGNDPQARQLRELMHEEGVNCEPLLVSSTVPTISKARVIARQQQIVRVDREVIEKLSDAELREVEGKLRALSGSLDAIIVEDYGKGFITEALMRLITRIATEAALLVTVDPSPRNPIRWSGVNLVKPNRAEAFTAAGIEDLHDATAPEKNAQLLQVGAVLLEKWDVPTILITLGEQGMMLFQRGETPHHIPTRAREVFDVSGAGDTVIAVLTLALASGMKLQQAAEAANYASGIVVGKLGTATLTPQELLAACAADLMSFSEIIASHLAEHLASVEKLRAQQGFIEDLAQRVLACLKTGNKVLLFGNGGSAADAQHIAAEFVVRYRQNRAALPAIALTTDTSILTAGANDFGFESIYARQVEALAQKGDVAIGISTSGNSPNVILGLKAARAKGCLSVAFTAEGGGQCAEVAELIFRAPSPVTARAQECHLLVGHILCDLVEMAVLGQV